MRIAKLILLLSIGTVYQSTINKSRLNVSIIIPCSFKHAPLLFPLIKLFERQTVLPNEVIISLSEIGKVEPAIINKLQTERWHFPVKLLLTDEKQFAGTNRNIACSNASGKLFICQDADDIPHPQRVEIIKYFFEQYDIDHLMHIYEYSKDFINFVWYEPSTVTYAFPQTFADIWHLKLKFHNGHIALSSNLFKQAQWSEKPRGQDTEFNKTVYGMYSKNIVIKIPLVVYRNELTTWHSNVTLRESLLNQNIHEQWERLYDAFYDKHLTESGT